jgi:hypothetical protein
MPALSLCCPGLFILLYSYVSSSSPWLSSEHFISFAPHFFLPFLLYNHWNYIIAEQSIIKLNELILFNYIDMYIDFRDAFKSIKREFIALIVFRLKNYCINYSICSVYK